MRHLYSFLVQLSWYVLHIIALFNSKIKLFVNGRKETSTRLETNLPKSKKTIWMHVASLGEYEQGLPVLQQLKKKYPEYAIVLSFFSPSGFEVKRDKTPADVVVYLPMDTITNAKRFIQGINPSLVLFIKYEIWPNYLYELKQREIPTLLVSGIFSKRQIYFKGYGQFMRKALTTFSHFFVQEEHSQQLLNSINFNNVSVSGDTRFDRVAEILTQENTLGFMGDFKGNSKCFVAGSTWPEDEQVILDYINKAPSDLKIVIAPHNIKENHIKSLQNGIMKKVVRYSEIEQKNVADAEVLLVDIIGLLTKIYSYASAAYVGGGFATGLHNTLEPAVFGIPVLIGPNYHEFNEANELVEKQGILVVKNKADFETTMNEILKDEAFAQKTGKVNTDYINENRGATNAVMRHIETLL